MYTAINCTQAINLSVELSFGTLASCQPKQNQQCKCGTNQAMHG